MQYTDTKSCGGWHAVGAKSCGGHRLWVGLHFLTSEGSLDPLLCEVYKCVPVQSDLTSSFDPALIILLWTF